MAKGRPDFSPTAVDVVLQPEWAAKEGTDKNFKASKEVTTYGDGAAVTYEVPAGKTLVITQIGGRSRARLQADANNNQMCEVTIYEYDGLGYVAVETVGGNGGAYMALKKPRVFEAGDKVQFGISNWANHDVHTWVNASGYEY